MIFGQDDNKGNILREKLENSPHSGHHKRRVDRYLTKEHLLSLLQVGNLSLHSFLFHIFWPVQTTIRYWYEWVSQSSYAGSWKEVVLRSGLALKPLIFKSTGTSYSDLAFLKHHVALVGAVAASPTFSLPEYIGGVRNWCSPSLIFIQGESNETIS
jgi:hypothetical protein